MRAAIALALVIGQLWPWPLMAAETYIPVPIPKPPRPLYIPKPIPKPDELLVNLHCRGVYGDMTEVPLWLETDWVDFRAVLGPCGSKMPKSDCEAAAARVNGFRPVIEGEGPVGWKLFYAHCAVSQPQTMI